MLNHSMNLYGLKTLGSNDVGEKNSCLQIIVVGLGRATYSNGNILYRITIFKCKQNADDYEEI